jgi:hypothetical protein
VLPTPHILRQLHRSAKDGISESKGQWRPNSFARCVDAVAILLVIFTFALSDRWRRYPLLLPAVYSSRVDASTRVRPWQTCAALRILSLHHRCRRIRVNTSCRQAHMHDLSPHRVIAILLGVLGMTVDDALTAFIGICEKVFAPNIYQETERSEILTTELKGILEGLNLPSDSRLAENLAHNSRCRVYVSTSCSSRR